MTKLYPWGTLLLGLSGLCLAELPESYRSAIERIDQKTEAQNQALQKNHQANLERILAARAQQPNIKVLPPNPAANPYWPNQGSSYPSTQPNPYPTHQAPLPAAAGDNRAALPSPYPPPVAIPPSNAPPSTPNIFSPPTSNNPPAHDQGR